MAVTGFAADTEAGVRLHYDRAHKAAAKRCGSERAPGRNVYREHSTLANGERVGKRLYRQLTARLDAMCRPLAAPVTVGATASGVTAPHPAAGGLPSCTWRPESGGDYNAVNPQSGAYGRYQIIPQTWAAHCSDLGHSPGEQDECAARIYRTQGAGAWVNC